MTHIMIDLETMGTDADAAIVAIGAVAFGENGVFGEPFYARVSLQSAIENGGTVTASTINWWIQQSEQAREEITQPGREIGHALDDFTTWIDALCFGDSPAGVWGNGAAFDNVILRTAFERSNRTPPWKFWADRCFRTLRAMRPDVPMGRQGVHHNALDDAITQATHVVALHEQGLPVFGGLA